MSKRILLCLLFPFFSCNDSTEEAVAALNIEETASILADQLTADAAVFAIQTSKKDSVSKVLYKQIFEIHETDLDTYSESLQILSKDPEKLRALYTKVDSLMGYMEPDSTRH